MNLFRSTFGILYVFLEAISSLKGRYSSFGPYTSYNLHPLYGVVLHIYIYFTDSSSAGQRLKGII